MTEQMLCTFEGKILRINYGPVQDKGHCRPRWNSEICNLYKDLNIVNDIKIIKLVWVGHIVRMEDKGISKKVLNGIFLIQNQWENQEQDGRTWSGGTQRRS
jgi:hypothetical protein